MERIIDAAISDVKDQLKYQPERQIVVEGPIINDQLAEIEKKLNAEGYILFECISDDETHSDRIPLFEESFAELSVIFERKFNTDMTVGNYEYHSAYRLMTVIMSQIPCYYNSPLLEIKSDFMTLLNWVLSQSDEVRPIFTHEVKPVVYQPSIRINGGLIYTPCLLSSLTEGSILHICSYRDDRLTSVFDKRSISDIFMREFAFLVVESMTKISESINTYLQVLNNDSGDQIIETLTPGIITATDVTFHLARRIKLWADEKIAKVNKVN